MAGPQEQFPEDLEQEQYVLTEEVGEPASVEVGLSGIKVDGSEMFIVLVLLALPALYFLKKKIDARFLKARNNGSDQNS